MVVAPLIERAFEIACPYDQRICDCFYVALAEREGVNFWTSDLRIHHALGTQFSFIRLIAAYIPPS